MGDTKLNIEISLKKDSLADKDYLNYLIYLRLF